MSAVKICPQCGQQFDESLLFCPRDGSALKTTGAEGALVGQVVAERYHVERELGRGGMGHVYLAEHVKIGRKAALKVIKPNLVSSPDALMRFNREAANASRISHPNVVQVYDFGESRDGLIFCAMEFIEGMSLAALLREQPALPPRRAAAIALQVADALGAAHELRIVHRDLKPENIMLARNRDGSDHVKVVDFGVSRVMEDDAQKVTQTGLVVGTVDYMSPEQFTGEPVDGRSDIFSLGIVLFRMLTGTLPFQARTALEAMEARVMKPVPRLKDRKGDVAWSEWLESIVARALAPQPDQRYATAAEFAVELEAAVAAWIPDQPGSKVPWDARLRGGSGPRPVAEPVARAPKPVPAPSPAARRPLARYAAVAVGGVALLTAVVLAVTWDGGKSAPPPADSTKLAQGGGTGTDTATGSDSGDTTGGTTSTGKNKERDKDDRTNTGGTGTGPGPTAVVETDEVRDVLNSVRLMTDSGSTDDEVRAALTMLDGITPRTREGQVEAKYRRLEASVIMANTDESCRLIRQLEREARGTRFEASMGPYTILARQVCH